MGRTVAYGKVGKCPTFRLGASRKQMVSIILWLLTILTGATITVLTTEPIHYLLATTFGAWVPRRPRGVKGIWCAEYSYRSRGVLKNEKQLIELRQFGNYVVGRSLTGQAHMNKLKGKVQLQMYFTGIWESPREREVYHGAFQCVVDVHGSNMKGKWLGFDSRHEVEHGPWEWTLLTQHLNAGIRKEVVAEFLQTGNTTNLPDKQLSRLTNNATHQRCLTSDP